MKKLGDMCDKYGVAMAIHMAESPIACMAAIHAAAAVQNVLAGEHHSSEVSWWNDLAIGIENPLIKDGFANVPDKSDSRASSRKGRGCLAPHNPMG